MQISHPLSRLHISYKPIEQRRQRDLYLHFHGANEIVFGAVNERFPDAIAATVNLNGLSGAYQSYIGQHAHWTFARLLAEIQQATESHGFDTVTVSSFSAGYGAVRSLLQDKKCVAMIDQLVLADTVYASFGEAQNIADGRPFPSLEQNKPFVEYARLAVRGHKSMLLTHCELKPETYSSTEEVGQHVRDAIGVQLTPTNQQWTDGVQVKGVCRKGRFASIATRGDQGSDHLAHLRKLSLWFRLLPKL